MSGAAAATPDVFRAIADGTRRALLDQLRVGEQTAGAIMQCFDTTPSAISQHLRVLLETGLVERRREGRLQIYALTPAPLRTVADWANSYEKFWSEKLDALGAYLAREDARLKGEVR